MITILFCLPLAVFLSTLVFSISIFAGLFDSFILSTSYQIFNLLYVIILLFYLRTYPIKPKFYIYILSLSMLVQFSLILGYAITDGPESAIWTYDALVAHLPRSIELSHNLSQPFSVVTSTTNPFEVLYLSNLWVALWFSQFGATSLVTATAISSLKLPTIFLLYKAFNNLTRNPRLSCIALTIYCFSPNIIFYTTVFYKDFFVHLLIALYLYILGLSMSKPRYIALSLLPISILTTERFYLSVILILNALVFYSRFNKSKLIILFFVIIVSIFLYYITQKYFAGYSIDNLFTTLPSFRDSHNNMDSVRPTSNLILDIFRATFTPFFAWEKVLTYNLLDSLLLLGGFYHQLVTLLYFRGAWITRSLPISSLNIFVLSIIIIVALIFPFNARARDNAYPVICLFAAYTLRPRAFA